MKVTRSHNGLTVSTRMESQMAKFSDNVWQSINTAINAAGLYQKVCEVAAEVAKATGEDVRPSHVATAMRSMDWNARKAERKAEAEVKPAVAPDAVSVALKMFAEGKITEDTLRAIVTGATSATASKPPKANSADAARSKARKNHAAAVAVASK